MTTAERIAANVKNFVAAKSSCPNPTAHHTTLQQELLLSPTRLLVFDGAHFSLCASIRLHEISDIRRNESMIDLHALDQCVRLTFRLPSEADAFQAALADLLGETYQAELAPSHPADEVLEPPSKLPVHEDPASSQPSNRIREEDKITQRQKVLASYLAGVYEERALAIHKCMVEVEERNLAADTTTPPAAPPILQCRKRMNPTIQTIIGATAPIEHLDLTETFFEDNADDPVPVVPILRAIGATQFPIKRITFARSVALNDAMVAELCKIATVAARLPRALVRRMSLRHHGVRGGSAAPCCQIWSVVQSELVWDKRKRNQRARDCAASHTSPERHCAQCKVEKQNVNTFKTMRNAPRLIQATSSFSLPSSYTKLDIQSPCNVCAALCGKLCERGFVMRVVQQLRFSPRADNSPCTC